MILVAAMLVGAVVLAISPQGANVRAAVCDAVGSILQTDTSCGSGDEGEGGDGGDDVIASQDDPFKPQVCQVAQSEERHGAVVHAGFLDLGENNGFIKAVMSDGTVTLTAATGTNFGGSGSVGAEVSAGGNLQLGGTIDYGGGVTAGSGDTWTFEGDDAEAKADAFVEKIKEERKMDAMYNVGGRGPTAMRNISTIDSVRPPDATTSEIGLSANAGVMLGLNLAGKKDGSGPRVQWGAAGASVAGDATWGLTTDTHGTESMEDDTRTHTVDLSYDQERSGRIWGELGLGKTEGMGMSFTHNADGEIIEVAIVTTSEGGLNGAVNIQGGGKDGPGRDANSGSASFSTSKTEQTATVTTTKLTLDPEAPGYAEDAEVVNDWLVDVSAGAPGAIPVTAINPARTGADPVSQLMHEQATVSAVTSEGVASASGLAAEVAAGVRFGFDASSSSSDTEAVSAAFLGAPEGGVRSMVPYDDCA